LREGEGGLGPILRQHRVDDGIFKPLTEPLRFAKDTLLDKSVSARNPSASHVPCRNPDFDAVQIPTSERVVSERLHSL
jgi:hypothetical protein